MKRVFHIVAVSFYLIFQFQYACAQNRNIDSLLTLTKIDKEDTNKVKHLNNLSREYANINMYIDGLNYGKQALQLA